MRLSGITIDSQSTQDIDDGLWVETSPTGWILTVVIADVSAHIRKGSPLDQEALRRSTTRYFARGNIPMLPRGLSENRLSLLPEKKRRVLAAKIAISSSDFSSKLESLNLEGFQSMKRVDYPDIHGQIGPNGHPELNWFAGIALGLLDKRRSEGALVVYDLLQGWITTEEGFLKQLKDVRETIGQVIVQEMMILANSLIAEWCVKENIPVLFRNHTARAAAPPMTEINEQIMMALRGPWQDMDLVRKRVHMLLDRADYGPSLKGHYGLSLPAYLHFTSPIRRYADLVNHRQIRAKLTGKPFPHSVEELAAIAQHINEVEQEERDKTKDHFKDKAEDKAEKALERGRLSRLNDKEFERVLKVEYRAGNDARESLVEEFLARLAENRVPPICLTIVCFHPPESPPDEAPLPGRKHIRDAVLAMLQEKPELGVTLWTLAVAYAKEEPLEYQEKRSGPAHLPVFQASARSGLFTSGWAEARTSKLARQRAAVWLLFRYHSLPERSWLMTNPEPESGAKKPPPYLKDLSEGRDPTMALMEYAAKNKLSSPNYDFKQEGTPHIPTITCTCSFNRRTGVGTASNKKDAKRLASQNLIAVFVKEQERLWVQDMADQEEAAGGFPGVTGRMSLQGALDSMKIKT